ncbi:MAG: IMP dehydrogenase, partial [Planctomycetota bacterium]|nr:IMP dehydrogenase [Planctomycetota bacterium]
MAKFAAPDGLTFDDVSLLPQYSEVLPKDVDTSVQLTPSIRLSIPLISAAMDTVTESRLATALAQEGGIGIIHKNLSVEQQAAEVERVKRSVHGVIFDPITLLPDRTVRDAKRIMQEHQISGLPVVSRSGRLVGIITRRDLRFLEDSDLKVSMVMTKRQLVTAPPDTTIEEARKILHSRRVEKLLLVDKDGKLRGLITMRDINNIEAYPYACRDSAGRLRVGAAVGPFEFDRAEELVSKGCDLLVIDTAHGHTKNVIETVKQLKTRLKVEVVAGNVATEEGVEALAEAGADAVKVGVGPGSACTTRIVAGVGAPQLSAVFNCALYARKRKISLIADGGIRYSGDIVKALAAGAHAVMLGNLFASTDESPGQIVIYEGRRFKTYRGMGSLDAMLRGSASRYGKEGIPPSKLVAEGIEGLVPLRGSLSELVSQLVGGLRSGMGYCGAKNLEEL